MRRHRREDGLIALCRAGMRPMESKTVLGGSNGNSAGAFNLESAQASSSLQLPPLPWVREGVIF